MNIWYQRHKVLVWIGGVVAALALLYLASWVARVGLFVYLTGQVQALTGLDLWLSRAVAVVLTVGILLLLPLLIPFYPKKKPLFLLGVVLAAGFCVGVYFAAQDVYFDPEGNTVKYYIRTPEGFKFSNSQRVDPTWGIRYEPITPEVAGEIGLSRTVHKQPLPPGTYFDPATGAPLKNYHKDDTGKIELFPIDVRYHPKWRTRLELITPAIVKEYEEQQKELVEKPRIRQAMARYQQADSELNALWRTELPKLEPDSQNSIRTLEREWIDFKNRQCNLDSAGSGQSAGTAASYECLAQLTEKRIGELKAYFKEHVKQLARESNTVQSTPRTATSVDSPKLLPDGFYGVRSNLQRTPNGFWTDTDVRGQIEGVELTKDTTEILMAFYGGRSGVLRNPYYDYASGITPWFVDNLGKKYSMLRHTGDFPLVEKGNDPVASRYRSLVEDEAYRYRLIFSRLDSNASSFKLTGSFGACGKEGWLWNVFVQLGEQTLARDLIPAVLPQRDSKMQHRNRGKPPLIGDHRSQLFFHCRPPSAMFARKPQSVFAGLRSRIGENVSIALTMI